MERNMPYKVRKIYVIKTDYREYMWIDCRVIYAVGGTDAINGEALMLLLPVDFASLVSLIHPHKSGVL